MLWKNGLWLLSTKLSTVCSELINISSINSQSFYSLPYGMLIIILLFVFRIQIHHGSDPRKPTYFS
ncbi:putative orphan protein [Pseudoalteromonas translucida]|uniref:Orphan protein n=1 Tax=Pseudoalteromonas translucida (strain TAC 125) TaxID=326442 RepID=Q3IJF8_PSET1|nr:putative orphan protein [Pseudoalteromonas translucida]